ncbi:B12-binding domain-containing radical SAM protein [Patescibacteria group bacterium]
MSKVLFFNPPSRQNVYLDTNVKVGAPSYPSLTIATLASQLVEKHQVSVIDLEFFTNFNLAIINKIIKFNPEIVCASSKTTDYLVVRKIMKKIKKRFPKIKTIIGGVHVTACIENVIKEDCFDIIIVGEGDTVLSEIISKKPLKKIPGLYFKDEKTKKTIFTGKRKLISDLNKLSYPAWHLFNLKQYKNSRLSSRLNPVGHIETSRGCSYQCNFCSKLIFGTQYRMKNASRVVDEMEYMLKCGFKEIHIADDSFTQNIVRAKQVCQEIIKRNLQFPWSLINGIRVNFVDLEFFKLAKKAGCWQVGFGIETGSQRVLNKIKKGITISQIKKAISLAHRVGLDTFGFFIFGLSGETEKSMKQTIELAKSLPLDTAKFDICIPYPGTSYFNELKSSARILSFDWSKYVCHQTGVELFDHPNLNWGTIIYYYHKAFREFYFRPSYIFRRFIRSLKKKDLIYDLQYFLKSKWY